MLIDCSMMNLGSEGSWGILYVFEGSKDCMLGLIGLTQVYELEALRLGLLVLVLRQVDMLVCGLLNSLCLGLICSCFEKA